MKIYKKKLNKLVRKSEQEYNKKIYKSYINSNEWKEKRNNVLRYYKECCRCDSKDKLSVHHGSYRRLQYELPSQLYVLCGGCHKEFHERYGVSESMKKKTICFIREVKKDFQPKTIMPPKQVENRISNRHCKYCNSELVIKDENRNPKTKGNYYEKTWKCSKNCTHGVVYLFEEDKIFA